MNTVTPLRPSASLSRDERLATRGKSEAAMRRILKAQQDKPKDIITVQEFEAMIATTMKTNTITNIRNRAILNTLYGSGVRSFELTNLLRTEFQINGDEAQLNLTIGKYDNQRLIPINQRTRKAIEEWLAVAPDSEYLFCSFSGKSAGNHMAERMVQYIAEAAGKKAGLTKHIHPHIFRHTFATNLAMSDDAPPIAAIQQVLGHSSLQTTQRYIAKNGHVQLAKYHRRRDAAEAGLTKPLAA